LRRGAYQHGAKTAIVSPAKGEVQGWNHFDKGDRFKVDVPLEQAKAEDFDALLLPGGVANPDQLRAQPKAVQFVKRFVDAGKPIGVICHGPWTLVEAGAVKGRTMTSWPSLKTDLTNAGAAASSRAASLTTFRHSAAGSSRRSARARTTGPPPDLFLVALTRNSGKDRRVGMFVAGVGTAVPPQRYTQAECWEAVRAARQFCALAPQSQALLRRLLLNEANGIRTRHLALEALDEAFEIEPDKLHARFARHAPMLAEAAARSALRDADLSPRDVDALVISTCTGYLCPGLTSYVGERLGLKKDVIGLDLVGQGCGAALPNLAAAHGLIAAGNARVALSICVEVCSAAFYIDDDPGVLVSACLFGDGAGALVLAAEPRTGRRRVEWRAGWSSHEPAHRDALRFEQRAGLLRNVLTPQVPALAGRQAAALLQDAGLRDRITTWIWHAGGQKVLERLRETLRLEPRDVERSARVLSAYGNLSSPFVYFVLELALRERAPSGSWWMSSFGAGFSCHGALLTVA